MDISKLSIYIERAWAEACGCGIKLTIGGLPTEILDPKESTTGLGLVYLGTRDYENGSW